MIFIDKNYYMKSIILEESELKQRFSQIYREEQIKILEEIISLNFFE